MGAIHRTAIGLLFRRIAEHRHRQIGQRGAGALDRVMEDRAAMHLALGHPVPHRRQRQLHDDIGAGRQHADRIQHPGETPVPLTCTERRRPLGLKRGNGGVHGKIHG